MSQIHELLEQCTVKITLPTESKWGTGFFVAPGLILTCAHVVEPLKLGACVQISWQQRGFAEARIIECSSTYDIALLQFSPPQNTNLPCVYLDREFQPTDNFYTYGYPDCFPDGASVTSQCEGNAYENQVSLILFKAGLIRPGFSGSPLLNLRTGKVCGIVKFTRNRSIDLGGGAISTKVISEIFPNLWQQHLDFHGRDRRWLQRMADLSKSIPDSKPKILRPVSKEVDYKYNQLVFMELNLYNELEIVEKNKFGIRLSIAFATFTAKVSTNSMVSSINAGDAYIRFGIKHGKLCLNLTNGTIPWSQRQLVEELNHQWLITPTGNNAGPIWEFESRGEPLFLQGGCDEKRIGVLDLLDTSVILEATFEVSPSRIGIKIIDFDDLWTSDIRPVKKQTMISYFLKKVIKPTVENYLSRVVLTYDSASFS